MRTTSTSLRGPLLDAGATALHLRLLWSKRDRLSSRRRRFRWSFSRRFSRRFSRTNNVREVLNLSQLVAKRSMPLSVNRSAEAESTQALSGSFFVLPLSPRDVDEAIYLFALRLHPIPNGLGCSVSILYRCSITSSRNLHRVGVLTQRLPHALPPLALEVDALLEDVVLDFEELELGGRGGGVDRRTGTGHADLRGGRKPREGLGEKEGERGVGDGRETS
jgi:hypothetical protein